MLKGQAPGARQTEFLHLIKNSEHDECWMWTHADNGYGYGRVRYDGRTWLGSRLAYTLLVGTIPKGMVLDHLCHTEDKSCTDWDSCQHRWCVNPAHLQPVAQGTNQGRAKRHGPAPLSHCKRGHEFSQDNTYTTPSGSRICRTCRTIRRKKYREQRKQRKD